MLLKAKLLTPAGLTSKIKQENQYQVAYLFILERDRLKAFVYLQVS